MVIGRLSRFGFGLLVSSAWACSGSSGPAASPLCPSVGAGPNGVTVADCPSGSETTTNIHYDSLGQPDSYDFDVACQGRQAHGSWNRFGGVQCTEGAAGVGTMDAGTPMDCTQLCQEWGDCESQNGRCIATEQGCAGSHTNCGISGLCHLGTDGLCTALSDADCRTPSAVAPPGTTAWGACAIYGNCYAAGGRCVAQQDQDCKMAEQCGYAGHCTLQNNRCVAATDMDCAASDLCRTQKKCVAVMGTCQVGP